MASREAHHVFSYEEYLARERETGLRHEFLEGATYAMAGGTPEHARSLSAVRPSGDCRLRAVAGGRCSRRRPLPMSFNAWLATCVPPRDGGLLAPSLPPNLLKGLETTRVQLAAAADHARVEGCFQLVS